MYYIESMIMIDLITHTLNNSTRSAIQLHINANGLCSKVNLIKDTSIYILKLMAMDYLARLILSRIQGYIFIDQVI